ncbi:MAG: class I SAM-dependent methyltransferase [Pseudomonadota bacterium]
MSEIAEFQFDGDDIKSFLAEKLGFDGDIVDMVAGNSGPVIHKWLHYLPIYDHFFGRFRETNVRFLEIGVSKGGSLKLWREYFGPDATIFGIDIDPACSDLDGRYGEVRIGSQTNLAFLDKLVDEMRGVDVIIDDGSHQMGDISATMTHLFPKLAVPGVYLIEDLHTAFWENYGGGVHTQTNFFRYLPSFAQRLHRCYHSSSDDGLPSGFDEMSSFHVYDSVTVLCKSPQHAPRHARVGVE